MKNLEQIRAFHAHRFWIKEADDRNQRKEADDRNERNNVVRGLSSLIMTNGLLATLAFSMDKQGDYLKLMTEIGQFLSSQGENGRNLFRAKIETLDEFIQHLINGNSAQLQMATDETLAYLSYLKRFRN